MSTLPTSTEITDAISGKGLSPRRAEQRQRDIAAVAKAMDPPPPPPPTDESLALADLVRAGLREPSPAKRAQQARPARASLHTPHLDRLLHKVEITPEDVHDQCDGIRRALRGDV